MTRANGKVALTRDGAFGVDASGTLVNAEGNRLSPPIKLPAGVSPSEVEHRSRRHRDRRQRASSARSSS